jgi:hypothetical protein
MYTLVLWGIRLLKLGGNLRCQALWWHIVGFSRECNKMGIMLHYEEGYEGRGCVMCVWHTIMVSCVGCVCGCVYVGA